MKSKPTTKKDQDAGETERKKTDWCTKLNGFPPGGKSNLNTYIVVLLRTLCLAHHKKWLQLFFCFSLDKQKKPHKGTETF